MILHKILRFYPLLIHGAQSIWLGYEGQNKFSFSEKTGSGNYEIQVRTVPNNFKN